MIKLALIFLICFFNITSSLGQTAENTGWLFLSNTHKISEKIDFLTDIQVRSADKFGYLSTLLLRGAVSYNFNKKHSAALGYAYKGDWEYDGGTKSYLPENRIYEQYLYDFNAGKLELNARLRLEQRFIKEDGIVDFSQRARAFISAQIPLVTDTAFTKGLYTSLQNEIFFNVLNREKVNGSLFDQNRSYVSLGYRFSRKIDAEFGYMYWFQKGMEGDTRTNVWQIMLTTKF